MRGEDVDARGMTDILAPLKLALAMLEGVQGECFSGCEGSLPVG